MAQLLDPIPTPSSDHIVCCYLNATSSIQVARITNVPNWYFERVVFPGQRLVFEALPEAILEIHTGMMASSILSDQISCSRLVVKENIESKTSSEEEGEVSLDNNENVMVGAA
ncbi:DUF1830 domain-containing protein [Euhalothece natronophila Z-M001]|uniref:DUF1830 domain-containing protein n=1 Tax=Euhalothece natronophila Z-M001 TaxID=522448 RepID=A0A5B8NPB9_9CHRO|nr:DUF1830 domain-containing protein [Euhalothece natronophila]QDZ40786.1 DUF1830 domain-containing protein [Euhalothece natronophila Z-M001]